MRLIDANELQEEYKKRHDGKRLLLIDVAPTVEPQRIKGKWERKESDLSWWYECSECGESPLFDPYEHEVRSPFCPWCGSEMRGDEDAAD